MGTNGNHIVESERLRLGTHPEKKATMSLPPWMAAMRDAVAASISAEDIQEIIKAQVKRAKAGDQQAIKFVFTQLAGGDLKGCTFIQNNYDDAERPDPKTKAIPGTARKVEIMRRRHEAGLPLNVDGDGVTEDEGT
jgi:hypothetical protein